MLVDFALTAERERGLSTEDAIHEACLLRFRPILMTTMCALLGGVPLMLGTGTGSELRQPLGYAMVGGLLVSQLLTLFTTPVVYIYMDRLSCWMERRSQRGQARSLVPAAGARFPCLTRGTVALVEPVRLAIGPAPAGKRIDVLSFLGPFRCPRARRRARFRSPARLGRPESLCLLSPKRRLLLP